MGKVSNTFGSSLGRDINEDGNVDIGVVLNSITGIIFEDFIYSIAIDGNGKIYVTGEKF